MIFKQSIKLIASFMAKHVSAEWIWAALSCKENYTIISVMLFYQHLSMKSTGAYIICTLIEFQIQAVASLKSVEGESRR